MVQAALITFLQGLCCLTVLSAQIRFKERESSGERDGRDR